jgi:excisionase family DNA binding protein
VTAPASPWLTVDEAAAYTKCNRRSIYRATAKGKLKAARVNDRGDLRYRAEWLDAWLEASAPVIMLGARRA